MKKIISIVLTILLMLALAAPAMAAGEPVITQQPKTQTFQELAVATYSVTVKGTNLKCAWYLRFNGDDYEISDMSGGMGPWEHYAGSEYGANVSTSGDTTTFTYYFEGIGKELDGCYIYAKIDNGNFQVTTDKAYIYVKSSTSNTPIIHVPAGMDVYQGDILDLYCSATAPDGASLSYLWYSCTTGKIENIIAVNRDSETSDTLRVDTSTVGTTYYVCMVSTSSGGSAYSSMIPVKVMERTQSGDPPVITTKSLPDATVGESYYVKLSCTDPDASFGINYNPGKANDFDKTGLNLTQHGEIEGTPTKAGTYGFMVCAAGENGEGYQVYTLKIKEAEATEPEQTEEITEPEQTEEITEQKQTEPESVTETPTEKPETPTEGKGDAQNTGTLKGTGGDAEDLGLIALLVVVCVLLAGGIVVVIILLTKKKEEK